MIKKFALRLRAKKKAASSFALMSATAALGTGLSLTALTVRAAEPTPSEAPTTEFDKVVVHAGGQLEQLRDVPTSVSIVTGEELERLGALSIADVLKRIGNVRFNYGNPRTGSFQLRGLSAGSSDAIDPSVGVVVDGVSYGYTPLSAGADFIDVATIDATRGPQGALGGKNTSVGQIDVVTKRPSFTPEADGSITFGDYNTLRTQAALGGPIVDDLLAWRGTFYRNQQDGAYLNHFADLRGRSSYVNTDRTYGRTQFLLTPTENFSARLSVEFAPKGAEYLNGLTFKKDTPAVYADGAAVNQTTQAAGKLARRWFTQEANYSYAEYLAYPVDMDNNGAIITGTKGASTELNWNWGERTVTSITAFKDHYFSAANDDGTPFDVTKDGGYITDYKQISQELRLSSQTGSFIDYRTGLYFIKTDNNSLSRTRYGSDAGAWNANATQYAALDANTNGRALLKDSLDRVYKATDTLVNNKSAAIYGQLDWHLSSPLTLTTGLRISHEDRRTKQSILVLDNGFGAALNPASVNDVQLGGFASTATGTLGAGNSVAQLNLADQVASQYFGAVVTATPGAAYNSLTASQKQQVAYAKAIRLAQFGTLYNLATAQPYKGSLPTSNLSLSYKLNNQLTTYVTWQHGEKSGVSQINGATPSGGVSVLVKPETSNAYELGAKTSLLNKTLVLNADVFVDDIRNFQQSVYYYDPAATALANDGTLKYSSGTGNVRWVRSRGVEVDAAYSGIEHLSLRFAGAYNEAIYKDHKYSGQPAENGDLATAFRDVSGKTLPNAPKLSFNLGADYRFPVFGNKLFHSSVNYNYTGRYNSDTALSDYAWVKAYGLVDFSVGLGRQDERFDVNLLVKNGLNTSYRTGETWNSWTPGSPRWIGIQFSGRL